MKRGMLRLLNLERLLMVAGVSLLGLFVMAHVDRALWSRAELAAFAEKQSGSLQAEKPDFSLWSAKRIQDYKASLAAHVPPPLAILNIPRIHLQVPVLDGTDEFSMNRGVGRIPGTAKPEENGNIGIAGHRDGFFRGLRDVALDDQIELDTGTSKRTYGIDRIIVVNPDDVWVLAPRERPSITLVTCYPFYFVGSAPQRYIVQASLLEPGTKTQSDRSGVSQSRKQMELPDRARRDRPAVAARLEY
jgi:sortase A